MAPYVLDTSAILCVLYQEEGADQVVEILGTTQGGDQPRGISVLVPFVALMEVEYWLLRRLTVGEVERTLLLIQRWPVEIAESNEEWRHRAARVKAVNPLSLADAWIASLAMLHGAELVHKDPEFDLVTGLESRHLPYRQTSR